jgi:hypothetical protein
MRSNCQFDVLPRLRALEGLGKWVDVVARFHAYCIDSAPVARAITLSNALEKSQQRRKTNI